MKRAVWRLGSSACARPRRRRANAARPAEARALPATRGVSEK
jgi:hypothetical protein